MVKKADLIIKCWIIYRSDEIFSGYVRELIKLKVESSDFPSNVRTHEEKIKWARQYKEELGNIYFINIYK